MAHSGTSSIVCALVDEPVEFVVVERLDEGLLRVERGGGIEDLGDHLAADLERRGEQLLLERSVVDLPDARGGGDAGPWFLAGGNGAFAVGGEAHVAEVENGADVGPHGGDVVLADADGRERLAHVGEIGGGVVLLVVEALSCVENFEALVVVDLELLVVRAAGDEIQGVVASLVQCRRDDAGFLEQILCELRADEETGFVELDGHEFTETRRVVVTDGPGVTERFEWK